MLSWREWITLGHIRQRDQYLLAIVVLLVALILGGYRAYEQLWGVGVVEFDTAVHTSVLFQVDVNRADWPELAQLPGVGETLARRIVADREQLGPFRSPRDLGRVKGLGEKTLERVMPHVLVTGGVGQP